MPAFLALAVAAAAQGIPASIRTIGQPASGRAIFDSASNVYYLDGPVTEGAAQTQGGGGTCYLTTGLIGTIPVACPDAHIVKVDPSGNVIWGTLLGGPTTDTGTALAVDAAGNVYVTGTTEGQFPTTPGAALGPDAPSAVFAAKVSSDGRTFLYSTYVPSLSTSSAIVVDGAGNAYVAGKTASGDAGIVKLSADGAAVLSTVTLAGSGVDAATALALDQAGNLVVAGETTSPDFPVTPDALQGELKGLQNSFVAIVDPAGNVRMSTYLGGGGSDSPTAVAVDGAGNIDLAGITSSLDFPATPGTLQPSPIVPAWNNSSPAGFVAQMAADGSALHWASYVMSSDTAAGLQGAYLGIGVRAMTVTPAGDIYVAGLTGPGFPVTPSAPVICFRGSGISNNGFLAHLNSHGGLLDATYVPNTVNGDLNLIGPVAPLPGDAVLVVWHGGGNNSLSQIQFGRDGWTAPACLSENVLNAATQGGHGAGNGGVVPGELVTLTGFGIGPEAGASSQLDAHGNIPTELAGVQVLFDGVPAPVLYADSRQINAIAPADLVIHGATNLSVKYNGQQLGPLSIPVTFGNPGVFRLHVGESAQAFAINQDGTVNGPANPAPRGSIVAVWGTGYGLTEPPCSIGGLNQPQAEPLRAGVTALIAARGPVFPAVYAGSAPGMLCGVVQINFQVPSNAAPGTFFFAPWIQLVDGNSTTQFQPTIGATIAVK